MRQASFLPKISLSHGGDERQGKRKILRPFDPTRPMHVTLRSSKARGQYSMLKRAKAVHGLVHAVADRRSVKIYRYVNVGNHLHLLIHAKKRRDFQAFFREIAGRVATLITGAHKGAPMGKFWDGLIWSRIVNWGRDFKNVIYYFFKNTLESQGERNVKARMVNVRGEKPPPDD